MEYITKRIGERYYNWDSQVKYLPTGSSEDLLKLGGNKLLWSLKWFKERLSYCDDLFEYSGESEKRIIFRTYTGNKITIGIQTVIPQRITVSFSDKMEHAMITKKCDQNSITYFEWDYAGDASLHICYITNGDLIQRITGFNDADLDSLVLEHCDRLIELECKNNPRLPTLTFQNSPRLVSVDISGCTGISGTLDFNASRSLKHLNVSQTGVTTLNISSSLYLETLDVSHSKIIQLSLDNQQNISSIATDGCENLAILSLQNCPNITSFVTSEMQSLTTLRLRGCANLEEIFISNSQRLSNLDYRDCPKLKYFTSENIPITSLEFSNLEDLELVNVSRSTNLSNLVLVGLPKLIILDISNTSVNRLDFTSATSQFAYANFRNSKVEQIINLNIYIRSKMDTSIFEGCNGLTSVTGLIKFGGECESAANLFNGMHNLVTIPRIELSDTIKSVSGMFKFCDSLSYINLGGSNTNGLEDMTELFSNCTSLKNIILDTWNTENVTKYSNAFYKVPKEAVVEISDEWYVGESDVSFEGKFWRTPYSMCISFTNSGILATDFFTNCFFINGGNHGDPIPYNDPRLKYVVKMKDGRVLDNIDGISTSDIKLVRVIYNSDITRITFGNDSSLNARESVLKNLYYLDSQSLTSLQYMFSGCINITTIDMNNLLNPNIIDISHFAQSCVNLTSIIVNSVDTSSVLSMASAFYNCKKLTNVDLSTWSADRCTNYESMFRECTSLRNVNIVRLNMFNASVFRMFENVPKTTTILKGYYLADKIEGNFGWTGTFTDVRLDASAPNLHADDDFDVIIGLTSTMEYSFNRNVWIKYDGTNPPDVEDKAITVYVRFSGTVSHKASEYVTLTFKQSPPYALFSFVENASGYLTNYFTGAFFSAYDGNTSVHYNDPRLKYEITMRNGEVHTGTGAYIGSLATADVATAKVMYDATITRMTFKNGIDRLIFIDTRNFVSMTEMFLNCATLKELDTSLLDMSKVWSLYGTFKGCTGLTSLDLSNKNSKSLIMMIGTFEGCSNLTTLNVSGWDVSKVYAMYNAFSGCSKLTTIDLSTWTTLTATNYYRLFMGCSKATLIDISGFTANGNVGDMFTGVPWNATVRVGKALENYSESDCGFTGAFTRV